MLSYSALASFIVVAAFTPGPNNCMALSHATRGLRNGVLFSIGVFGGMLLVMLACGFLSSVLTAHLDSAQTLMKILGCSYMLWLAWCLWRSDAVADSPVQGSGNLLFSGCILQIVNPKLIAYGITAYSVFILPHVRETQSLIWFAIVLALVGFLGTLAWALCGAGMKKLFQQHPVLINRVLALTVVGCAVSMVL